MTFKAAVLEVDFPLRLQLRRCVQETKGDSEEIVKFRPYYVQESK